MKYFVSLCNCWPGTPCRSNYKQMYLQTFSALIFMANTMRPTLFSPHLLYGRGYDSQVGICAWLNASDVISIFWSSPNQRLDLYFRLTDTPLDAINRLWKVSCLLYVTLYLTLLNMETNYVKWPSVYPCPFFLMRPNEQRKIAFMSQDHFVSLPSPIGIALLFKSERA